MKKAILFIFILLISTISFSQIPQYNWAKSIGGTGGDKSTDIFTDKFNNTIVVGYFNSSKLYFPNNTLTNVGGNDIFVAKYNSNGDLLWAKSAGGNMSDIAHKVFVDKEGNIFISGMFGSSNLNFGNTVLASNGASDIFIAKYDKDGNSIWAKRAGSANGNEECYGLVVDKSGNPIIGGSYNSTIVFDNDTLVTTEINAMSTVYVAKYTKNGELAWAKTIKKADNSLNFLADISIDTYDNVYICGQTGVNAEIYFDKIDTLGNVAWSRIVSGENNPEIDMALGITNDNHNNVIVVGVFRSNQIKFDGNIRLNKAGYTDVFVAKYDSDGSFKWAKSIGGTSYEVANGVSSDNAGNVYLIGDFYSSDITFASQKLLHDSNGNGNLILASYDSNGNERWAKSVGGISGGYGVSLSSNGEIYITGIYLSPTITLDNYVLYNVGTNRLNMFDFDFFVAKINSTTTSIEEYENIDLEIYPNPTHNIVNITGLSSIESSIVNIYDVQGKLILSKEIKQQGTIDISELNKGIYIVKIGEFTHRIVKI